MLCSEEYQSKDAYRVYAVDSKISDIKSSCKFIYVQSNGIPRMQFHVHEPEYHVSLSQIEP